MPIRPEMRDKYPVDWKAISARIRFERAGGQCEWMTDGVRCQARHGEPHPITGSMVVLTTMHLDHEPSHCDDSNLLAACQAHHNAYDMPMRRAGIKKRARAKCAIGDLI
jgi:hypothetical protein